MSRILLVGLMAVGKSAVGRALAARLGCPYLDNDELVLRASGGRLDDLRRQRGEAGLRAAESAALTEALTVPPPVVAGVAAGVVRDPADRSRLREAEGMVVWLRARPETLAARVDDGGDRPWLRPNPLAAFHRMAAEREHWYAEVAALTVDVDATTAQEAAQQILARLPSARRASRQEREDRPPSVTPDRAIAPRGPARGRPS